VLKSGTPRKWASGYLSNPRRYWDFGCCVALDLGGLGDRERPLRGFETASDDGRRSRRPVVCGPTDISGSGRTGVSRRQSRMTEILTCLDFSTAWLAAARSVSSAASAFAHHAAAALGKRNEVLAQARKVLLDREAADRGPSRP
jgi:hypothetical protein